MTEQPAASAGRPVMSGGRPATGGQPAAARPRPTVPRLARNPLPVIAATVAAFLVVLVLLTARVVTGHDPALQTPSAAVVSSRGTHQVLRTTASGRVIAVGTQGASGAARAQPAAIVTRASGVPNGGGQRDE